MDRIKNLSLDQKAKLYYMALLQKGMIDRLPDNPKAAYIKDMMDKDDYGRSVSGKDKRTFMEPEDSMPAARARKLAGMEDDEMETRYDYDDPIFEAKFKEGDTVIPNMGPHKGVKHKIIYDFGDGKYNIQPIGLRPNQIQYRLGAARASEDQLKTADDVNEGVRFSVITGQDGYQLVRKSNSAELFITKKGKTVGTFRSTGNEKKDIMQFQKMVKSGVNEGDTYEKMAAKGKKAGNLKQGTVRKRLRIKDGEKIPLARINKAISGLKKRKSLSDKDKKYLKALNLAKTLKTTTNVKEIATELGYLNESKVDISYTDPGFRFYGMYLHKDGKRFAKISYEDRATKYLKNLGVNTEIPRRFDTDILDKIEQEIEALGIKGDYDAAMDVS